jgi:hypothetical protein
VNQRDENDIEVPERTHDQPAEGGREQADDATEPSSNPRPEDGEAAGEVVE